MKGFRRAAYQAGRELYGEDLVYRSGNVVMGTLSGRVKHLLEEDTEPSVCGLVDDYEYAFTMKGKGIEASGDAITDPKLADNGYVMLYDPEFGIAVLRVDLTTEEMYKMINGCE